jgi:hypothetical protein
MNNNNKMGGGTPIEVPVTSYQLPREDVHDAVLVAVVGIGSQVSKYGRNQQVIFTFELTDESAVFHKENGPEPFTQSATFNMTMGKGSNLRKVIEQWRGPHEIEIVRHDLGRLLGKPAQVQVVHKEDKETGQVKARLLVPEGIKPPRRGIKETAPHNPLLQYAIKEGRGGVFDQLPKWIQDKILLSGEMNGQQLTKEEIARRNMAQATENAIAEAEQNESPESDESEDSEESNETDETVYEFNFAEFDLDDFSDEQFRDPRFVKDVRKAIDSFPVANSQKLNWLTYLNNLVRRAAKAKPADDGDDEMPY